MRIEPAEIIRELRADAAAHYDLDVLDSLERVVSREPPNLLASE